MYFALFLLVIVVMAAASARTIKNNFFVLGKSNTIDSKILGEKRKVWVYVPASAKDPANSGKMYPVVYLLDGDAHFSWLNKMVQELNGINGARLCQDMIVVAIPNVNRTRDLTPSNYLYGPDGNQIKGFEASGGGEKFADFIGKELVPYIDSVYPTDAYRALLGHSFGGLAVMNIAVSRSELFSAYVAIEPSMWWDNKKLLNQVPEALKEGKFSGKSLFLGIANNMPAGMDITKVRSDTSSASAHMRSVLELVDVFEDNPDGRLQYSYKYYNECDHNSVPAKAAYDAMNFLFGCDGE
jgi:predicted alpha/beta superfamily hydrolase